VIAACIRLTGCRVKHVVDAGDALPALEQETFDLVVWGVAATDVRERGDVVGELRERTAAPLVLIDGGSEMAQLDLEAGADQWLPKPFVPGALVGSLRAVMRNWGASVVQVPLRVEIRGMVLDGTSRRLAFAGGEASLTRQEWSLLTILVSHPNRFLGAREIVRLGWRAGEHGPEQLRTYVRRLRLKLEPMSLPCRLVSQHGQGYCLNFD
jgi:DNA-binding response OmpR family regulator